MTATHTLLHSSESQEWYTPSDVVEALHRFWPEGIALDPASTPEANALIDAQRIYTRDDDGLAQPWHATTVFLNPPYGRDERGRSRAEIWTHKLLDEWAVGNTDEAVLLVNAGVSNRWFSRLKWFPICFPDRRLKYWQPGKRHQSPTNSNALVLLPDGGRPMIEGARRFARAFAPLGPVLVPVDWVGRFR